MRSHTHTQIHAAYQFTCVVTQRNSHGRSVTVAFLEVRILFAYPGDGWLEQLQESFAEQDAVQQGHKQTIRDLSWLSDVVGFSLPHLLCFIPVAMLCSSFLVNTANNCKHMYCDVLREATNEWGNFHLKQPFGIFSEQGYRLGSAEEVGCQGQGLSLSGLQANLSSLPRIRRR